MSFEWTNKIDGVDDVAADDINTLAKGIIKHESDIANLSDRVDANAQSISQLSDKSEQINIELQTKTQNLENDISQVSKNVDAVSNKIDNVEIQLDEKVDKQSGKQLSTEDYTTGEKQKLTELSNAVAVDSSGNVDIKGELSVKGIDILSRMNAINLSAQDGIKALQSKSIPYNDISDYPIYITDHLVNENVIDYKLSGNSVQDGTPTPETPIEIQSVGDLITDEASEYYGKYDIQITVAGKNLIPYPYANTTITKNGITFTDNGDGTITANGTASSRAQYIIIGSADNYMLPVGTYILSGCPSGGDSGRYSMYSSFGKEYGNGISRTVSENEKFYVNITIESGATVSNLVFKPQLEFGTAATEYELYSSKTVHIYLDEPLRKVGNYADYIDYKNQKVVRNINSIKFTADKLKSITYNRKTFDTGCDSAIRTSKSKSTIGSYSYKVDYDGSFHWYVVSTGSTQGYLVLISPSEDITIGDYFTSIGIETDVEFMYPIATPIEEHIVVPEITSPNSAVMNISSGTAIQPTQIDLTYYQDIKKIIRDLQNAILSLGGNT